MRLDQDFYLQDSVTVAKYLVGQLLVRMIQGVEVICRIVETEAYVGPEDKGSHAYRNKRTKRTEVIFAPGGKAYVYLIYGMYHCLNIVTNRKDKPETVLIRACEPLTGWEKIKKNRQIRSKKLVDYTNGPGKLCQALAIDMTFTGCDMIYGDLLFVKQDITREKIDVVADTRINIDYAQEYRNKLWRFYIMGNSYVSQQ